jgi:hypothetical protein
VVDTGKFIEIFHRGDDGEWRVTNDIWNSDMDALNAMLESKEGQAAAAEDGVRMDTLQVLTEAE